MSDALAHLRSYPSGNLDPADAEAVESLITLYLDGSLDPDVAEQVTAAIEADDALAAIVAEAMEGKAWIEEVFAPESRRLMERPASQATMDLIHDLVAGKGSEKNPAEATVVPLRAEAPKPQTRWRPWLMAASIAALLVVGGTSIYTVQIRFDEAASRQLALEQQVEQLTAERQQDEARTAALDNEVAELRGQVSDAEESRGAAEAELAEANRTIISLQIQQAGLEQQVATLRTDVATATEQAQTLEQQRAALTSDVDRLQAALAEAEGERTETTATLAIREDDIADLRAEIGELGSDLTEANEARATATAQLSDAETMATLQSERTDLERRLAALDAEVERAGDQAQSLEQQRSTLVSEIEQLRVVLADAEAERDDGAIALTVAEQAREAVERQLAESESTIDDLQVDRSNLHRQVATLALEAQTIASTLGQRENRLAEVEQELATAEAAATDARQQIAQLAIDQRGLETELAKLKQQNQWPFQVAQYHQRFAGQPRRRWVEVSGKDQAELQEFLTDLGAELGLDEPVPLPQVLADAGLKFMGSRMLVINGMPVAQLAYRDSNDELFAFCFMRNMMGSEQAATPTRIGDLHMVDWRDQAFQYVVIGYEPVDVLGGIANQLQLTYRLDT